MPKPIAKRRVGRPRERAYRDGDRVPLSLRVTPQLKNWLDRASEMSGRSQSQEVEFRLEQSERTDGLLPDALLLRHGIMGARLMLALSAAVETLRQMACYLIMKERGAWSPHHWLDDPRCQRAIAEAAARVIARLDPASPVPPPAPALVPTPPTWDGLGAWAADWAVVQWQAELVDKGLLHGKRTPTTDKPRKDRSQSK